MPLHRRSFLACTSALGAIAAGGLSGCANYPAEYVARVLAWRDSDVGDVARFARRPVAGQPGAPEWPEAAGAEAQAQRLRAAFARLRPTDAAALAPSRDRSGSEASALEAWLTAQGTQGLVVLRHGHIVYEAYFNGHQREHIATSFSVAKSVLAALVDQAVEAGELPGLEAPVTRWLPELATREPRFAAITLRHLLDMNSGIRYREFPFLNGDDAKAYYMPDLRRLALQGTEIERPPGLRWQYNNYHPLLLGLVLERATGQRVADLLSQRLWAPGGFGPGASWSLDSPDTPERPGFEKLESGINARVRDFARFGQLFLDQGRARNGRQLLSAAAVRAATSPPAVPAENAQRLDAMRPGLWHRHFWWGQQHPDGTHDFSARGDHGQFVHVTPRHGVVIARNGERYGVPPGEWMRLFEGWAAALGAEG